uniref:Small ribosomal subunit protein uS3c n=1 Tax=Proboscia sp. TaxID=1923967 RepID=A0A2U9NM89_9STRA|nr:ribosomal protein S3 [Proboscia sp.]
MGQKTHPLGFRLGVTQTHKSEWYANLNEYSFLLKEDDNIRTYIQSLTKTASISNIQINRNSLGNQIQLNIETGRPGVLVGEKGAELRTLLVNLKKIVPKNRQIILNIIEVNLSASLLGDFVVTRLESRIAFRTAIRKAIVIAQKANIGGIKIQVSGRLNGAEMARSEWVREGRVPLQTLRADIDYVSKEAKTIYGILGIKVWLFKSEILIK